VFPVRYELNVYMLFRRNLVFKGLKIYLYLKMDNVGWENDCKR
jgi:hypothetical protein